MRNDGNINTYENINVSKITDGGNSYILTTDNIDVTYDKSLFTIVISG